MAIQRRLTDKEYHAIHDYISAAEYLKKAGISLPLGLSVEMIRHGTTDGLPFVEPPLTDEDARARPWVMVRDDENCPWVGPKKYLANVQGRLFPYYVIEGKSCVSQWSYCRRATEDEIAANVRNY